MSRATHLLPLPVARAGCGRAALASLILVCGALTPLRVHAQWEVPVDFHAGFIADSLPGTPFRGTATVAVTRGFGTFHPGVAVGGTHADGVGNLVGGVRAEWRPLSLIDAGAGLSGELLFGDGTMPLAVGLHASAVFVRASFRFVRDLERDQSSWELGMGIEAYSLAILLGSED